MLALRLQRVGRKKLAQYRLIAQEHSLQPTSGKVAAYLGSYNPHTKEAQLKKEEIEKYLSNGAQPSNSAAKLLKKEGVKLPDWVTIKTKEAKAEEVTEESKEAEDSNIAAQEAQPSEKAVEETKEVVEEAAPEETKEA